MHRLQASGKTVTVPRPLARTWAELSEEDERLITLRDAGRTWPDIRKEWEVMTGETVGSSTLPNRYSRLKTNLTVINEEDCARMFESLSEVETAFQREKWNLVANSVVAKGGTEYKVCLLWSMLCLGHDFQHVSLRRRRY